MVDTPAETAEETPYDIKVEDAGPATKQLTITVPPETIAEKIEDSIGTLAVQTVLPGFRKGRAPRRLLERRFGGAVRTETKSQIIADAYASAIETLDIRPVGEPQPVTPVEDLEIKEGEALTFTLEVEVVPVFELPDVAGIEIKKPMVEIGAERIDREVERYRMESGESEEISGDFAEGDRLVGPARVVKAGVEDPIFEHQSVLVIMPGSEDGGRGQVLGLMIDGLREMLEGTKVGDTITIETKGPEAHERDDVRGADLTIEYTLRHAARIHPIDETALAAAYGLPSADAVREQIKLAMEQRRDQEQAAVMREQVHEHLIGAVDFELPQRLSTTQAARDLERARIEMLYEGVPTDEVETRLAEMREDSEARSRDRLKLFFILQKLADDLEIDVSEQEINGRIAEIARARSMRPDAVRAELTQSGRLGIIGTQIREHKAADRIVHQARVVELSADEWHELVRAKRGEGAKTGSKKKTSTKKSTTKKSSAKKTTTKKKKKTTKKKTSDG
jgi:trigger factor